METGEDKLSYRTRRKNKQATGTASLVTVLVCIIALAALTGCALLILENRHLKIAEDITAEHMAADVLGLEADDPGPHIDMQDPFMDERLTDEGVFTESTYIAPDSILSAELLGEIKERIIRGEDISAIWRALFTDDIVVGADGSFYFFPLDDELKRHDYVSENFILDDERVLTYQDENGNVLSQKGIDVSRYQLEIDWEKVAADGVEFAIIRLGYRGSSEGTLVLDPYYEANIEGALANGIDVGVYFFTQALNEAEAIEEAEFVLEHIAGYTLTYPVALDVEAIETANPRTANMTREEWTDATIAFCERIQEAGYTPMIYGNLRTFFLMLDLSRLEAYEKWFAFYRTPIYFPYQHSIWQYSATGRVDGIEGDVDLNVGMRK